MAEHTPGPWVAVDPRHPPIAGEEVWLTEVHAAKGQIVALDNYLGLADPNKWLAEMSANARLIAAAPDLLAVLEEFLKNAEEWQHAQYCDWIVFYPSPCSCGLVHFECDAEAAIALAKG